MPLICNKFQPHLPLICNKNCISLHKISCGSAIGASSTSSRTCIIFAHDLKHHAVFKRKILSKLEAWKQERDEVLKQKQ